MKLKEFLEPIGNADRVFITVENQFGVLNRLETKIDKNMYEKNNELNIILSNFLKMKLN